MICAAIKNCKSMVIDDTNVTVEIRRYHIRMAQRHGDMASALYFANIRQVYILNL